MNVTSLFGMPRHKLTFWSCQVILLVVLLGTSRAADSSKTVSDPHKAHERLLQALPGPDWTLLAKQDSSQCWFDAASATTLLMNPQDPGNPCFMIIGSTNFNNFRQADGSFVLAEQWTLLNGSTYFVSWQQTSAPTSSTITGFQPLSSAAVFFASGDASKQFGGIRKSANGGCALNGNPDVFWWSCIGAQFAYEGGIPGPWPNVAKSVVLSIKQTSTSTTSTTSSSETSTSSSTATTSTTTTSSSGTSTSSTTSSTSSSSASTSSTSTSSVVTSTSSTASSSAAAQTSSTSTSSVLTSTSSTTSSSAADQALQLILGMVSNGSDPNATVAALSSLYNATSDPSAVVGVVAAVAAAGKALHPAVKISLLDGLLITQTRPGGADTASALQQMTVLDKVFGASDRKLSAPATTKAILLLSRAFHNVQAASANGAVNGLSASAAQRFANVISGLGPSLVAAPAYVTRSVASVVEGVGLLLAHGLFAGNSSVAPVVNVKAPGLDITATVIQANGNFSALQNILPVAQLDSSVLASVSNGSPVGASAVRMTQNLYGPAAASCPSGSSGNCSASSSAEGDIITLSLSSPNGTELAVQNLQIPVVIVVPLNMGPSDYEAFEQALLTGGPIPTCRFWDDVQKEWSSEGCRLLAILGDGSQLHCACTHLTPFGAFGDFLSSFFSELFTDLLGSVLYCANVGTLFSLQGLQALTVSSWVTRDSGIVLWTMLSCLAGYFLCMVGVDVARLNDKDQMDFEADYMEAELAEDDGQVGGGHVELDRAMEDTKLTGGVSILCYVALDGIANIVWSVLKVCFAVMGDWAANVVMMLKNNKSWRRGQAEDVVMFLSSFRFGLDRGTMDEMLEYEVTALRARLQRLERIESHLRGKEVDSAQVDEEKHELRAELPDPVVDKQDSAAGETQPFDPAGAPSSEEVDADAYEENNVELEDLDKHAVRTKEEVGAVTRSSPNTQQTVAEIHPDGAVASILLEVECLTTCRWRLLLWLPVKVLVLAWAQSPIRWPLARSWTSYSSSKVALMSVPFLAGFVLNSLFFQASVGSTTYDSDPECTRPTMWQQILLVWVVSAATMIILTIPMEMLVRMECPKHALQIGLSRWQIARKVIGFSSLSLGLCGFFSLYLSALLANMSDDSSTTWLGTVALSTFLTFFFLDICRAMAFQLLVGLLVLKFDKGALDGLGLPQISDEGLPYYKTEKVEVVIDASQGGAEPPQEEAELDEAQRAPHGTAG